MLFIALPREDIRQGGRNLVQFDVTRPNADVHDVAIERSAAIRNVIAVDLDRP